MFSFVSFDRKNPIASVRAFRQAFGDADNRLLILKCSDAEKAPKEMAKLQAAIGDASNIRIQTELLSDVDRLDLIASADVLLSLHRSEGFGLVMAEAMRARVPVIATAWSGNLDYMDESSALLVPIPHGPWPRRSRRSTIAAISGRSRTSRPRPDIYGIRGRSFAVRTDAGISAHARAQRQLGLEGIQRGR